MGVLGQVQRGGKGFGKKRKEAPGNGKGEPNKYDTKARPCTRSNEGPTHRPSTNIKIDLKTKTKERKIKDGWFDKDLSNLGGVLFGYALPSEGLL